MHTSELVLLLLAAALLAFGGYVWRLRTVNRRMPALSSDAAADPVAKWRRRLLVTYHLSAVEPAFYRAQRRQLVWVVGWLLSGGASVALMAGGGFGNVLSLIWPLLMALSGLGMVAGQYRQLMLSYQAWLTLVEQAPEIAATLGVSAADLPAARQRVQALAGARWLAGLGVLLLSAANLVAVSG